MGLPLPAGVSVLERGWLSSNSIVLAGEDSCALVDSGYASHATQTLQLVEHALQGRALDVLLNTHLHSDHVGGNAALQARYPGLRTLIPPGDAALVAAWDEARLSYRATGQQCPRFRFDATLVPGSQVRLGAHDWQVHAAPGHDTHSVILFEPASRTLVSADALWERGFGVVFPELEGEDAFHEVAATLDVIEALDPLLVIPGHGAVFTDVRGALAAARKRLDGFVADPQRHLQHAARVLLKFKLLEWQSVPRSKLLAWAEATPYVARLVQRLFAGAPLATALDALVQDLVQAGAARWQSDVLHNA